jgi:hypothetical protein
MTWIDAQDLTVEGLGWADAPGPYDRLPARAEAVVSAPVWHLSGNAAGVLVRFVTDSPTVAVRWTLRSDEKVLSVMSAAVFSGVDLYARDECRWRFLGAGMPDAFPHNECMLVAGLAPAPRELMLNLPLYNGVDAVAIGVEEGASIAAATPDTRPPLCMYGTSIVQGASASRPGMCHVAMLRRRLDHPTLNLGFAGNGTMEAAVGSLLAELDVAAYVIDSLPNMAMAPGLVEDRAGAFLSALVTAHPAVPILVVGATTRVLHPLTAELFTQADGALRTIGAGFQDAGGGVVRFVDGAELLGDDEDGTVDTVHPNDLGFARMAMHLEPLIADALGDDR